MRYSDSNRNPNPTSRDQRRVAFPVTVIHPSRHCRSLVSSMYQNSSTSSAAAAISPCPLSLVRLLEGLCGVRVGWDGWCNECAVMGVSCHFTCPLLTFSNSFHHASPKPAGQTQGKDKAISPWLDCIGCQCVSCFQGEEKSKKSLSCLVLSCFFRVHPLGGLFLAHAEAGLHCTVQSITSPWAGCSVLMHLNHFGALCGSYTCIARPRP